MQQTKLVDVLVVGGGLSGLLVAHGLHKGGEQLTWHLLEARSVLGGRLANQHGEIDMGGAWLWPEHQPHARKFLNDFEIPTFPQPGDYSSTRIDGGAVAMVHRLADEVAGDRKDEKVCKTNNFEGTPIQLNSAVTHCRLRKDKKDTESLVEVETANGQAFTARRVVFAVPPKLIDKHVTFDPPLSEEKQKAMANSHTWMAGVTKVALLYPNRFWSPESANSGLPNNGPAFQVYDSGTHDGSINALTFFALVPPNSPAQTDDSLLAQQVADQMAQLWTHYLGKPQFAKQARSYSSYHVQRWPLEKYLSEDNKPDQIHPHPSPVRALSTPEWDGKLLFAGSETDLSSPGVMEGAIGATKRVLREILALAK